MRMDIGHTVHNILACVGTTIHIVGLARGYHHVCCLDRVDTTIQYILSRLNLTMHYFAGIA